MFSQDIENPIAAALHNLAYYPSNVLRILEDGGMLALFYLCSLSVSRSVRFMSALALSYMFDERYLLCNVMLKLSCSVGFVHMFMTFYNSVVCFLEIFTIFQLLFCENSKYYSTCYLEKALSYMFDERYFLSNVMLNSLVV